MSGKRILVLEDEFLIAMHLESELQMLGHDVVGPAHSCSHGLELAQSEPIDLAILDVNVAGEYPTEIAAALNERNVPFVYLTGYDAELIHDNLPDAPIIPKPVDVSQLKAHL